MNTHEILQQLISAAKEAGRKVEDFYAEGRRYKLLQKDDGWVQVIDTTEVDCFRPIIEAANFDKAKSYCSRLEPIRVPFSIL